MCEMGDQIEVERLATRVAAANIAIANAIEISTDHRNADSEQKLCASPR